MTTEQIRSVCQQYTDLLSPRGQALPEKEGGSKYQHIVWMCMEIPKLLDQGKSEKANRWLGFVQGYLWDNNIYSINEMRDHNR